MNLKIGGSNVGKIMYGGQEFGGATKLEPGTILYIGETRSSSFKDAHLFSTTKKWENINGINISIADYSNIEINYSTFDISGDDFKNLDIEKEYKKNSYSISVYRSIVDGEYRLNVSCNTMSTLIIRAI